MEPGRRALLRTPFVATLVWYLSSLAQLAVLNGGIRWRTDVVALGFGAATLGLVIASLVTLFVAAPLYVSLPRARRMNLSVALFCGFGIGIGVSLALAWLTGQWWSLLLPWDGALIGLMSAAVWRWQVRRWLDAEARA